MSAQVAGIAPADLGRLPDNIRRYLKYLLLKSLTIGFTAGFFGSALVFFSWEITSFARDGQSLVHPVASILIAVTSLLILLVATASAATAIRYILRLSR